MIMKVFKKGKSNKTFLKEVDLHRAAAEIGVAPPIIDFYVGGTDSKKGAQSYIVMEQLDRTVLNIIKSQKALTDSQWKEIINLYRKLDTISILHNDANPNNLMYQFHPVPRFFLIDFGMSKRARGNVEISYQLLRTRLLREEKLFSNSSG